jgi:hypothetical protein
MAMGAYSVVRYSDNFRDERVNLGVVVWHPTGGFECRFLPSLERIKAINPHVKTMAVRQQIRMLETRLSEGAEQGRGLLDELSGWLKEGLEFSKPYPTRLTAANETATRLYDMLVPPSEAPQQRELDFQTKISDTLRDQLLHVSPQSRLENLGERWVAGVRINIGLHAQVRNIDMLWRTISMRARAHEDQIARAKSAAMDILKIRGLVDYQTYRHIVAVDSPARFAGQGLTDAKRWIEDVGATVLEIADSSQMAVAISGKLQAA